MIDEICGVVQHQNDVNFSHFVTVCSKNFSDCTLQNVLREAVKHDGPTRKSTATTSQTTTAANSTANVVVKQSGCEFRSDQTNSTPPSCTFQHGEPVTVQGSLAVPGATVSLLFEEGTVVESKLIILDTSGVVGFPLDWSRAQRQPVFGPTKIDPPSQIRGVQAGKHGHWELVNVTLALPRKNLFYRVSVALQTFHMLVVGDSIAWGQGLRPQDKYWFKLAVYFQSRLPVAVKVTHVARSGATIEHDEHEEGRNCYNIPSNRQGTLKDMLDPYLDVTNPLIFNYEDQEFASEREYEAMRVRQLAAWEPVVQKISNMTEENFLGVLQAALVDAKAAATEVQWIELRGDGNPAFGSAEAELFFNATNRTCTELAAFASSDKRASTLQACAERMFSQKFVIGCPVSHGEVPCGCPLTRDQVQKPIFVGDPDAVALVMAVGCINDAGAVRLAAGDILSPGESSENAEISAWKNCNEKAEPFYASLLQTFQNARVLVSGYFSILAEDVVIAQHTSIRSFIDAVMNLEFVKYQQDMFVQMLKDHGFSGVLRLCREWQAMFPASAGGFDMCNHELVAMVVDVGIDLAGMYAGAKVGSFFWGPLGWAVGGMLGGSVARKAKTAVISPYLKNLIASTVKDQLIIAANSLSKPYQQAAQRTKAWHTHSNRALRAAVQTSQRRFGRRIFLSDNYFENHNGLFGVDPKLWGFTANKACNLKGILDGTCTVVKLSDHLVVERKKHCGYLYRGKQDRISRLMCEVAALAHPDVSGDTMYFDGLRREVQDWNLGKLLRKQQHSSRERRGTSVDQLFVTSQVCDGLEDHSHGDRGDVENDTLWSGNWSLTTERSYSGLFSLRLSLPNQSAVLRSPSAGSWILSFRVQLPSAGEASFTLTFTSTDAKDSTPVELSLNLRQVQGQTTGLITENKRVVHRFPFADRGNATEWLRITFHVTQRLISLHEQYEVLVSTGAVNIWQSQVAKNHVWTRTTFGGHGDPSEAARLHLDNVQLFEQHKLSPSCLSLADPVPSAGRVQSMTPTDVPALLAFRGMTLSLLGTGLAPSATATFVGETQSCSGGGPFASSSSPVRVADVDNSLLSDPSLAKRQDVTAVTVHTRFLMGGTLQLCYDGQATGVKINVALPAVADVRLIGTGVIGTRFDFAVSSTGVSKYDSAWIVGDHTACAPDVEKMLTAFRAALQTDDENATLDWLNALDMNTSLGTLASRPGSNCEMPHDLDPGVFDEGSAQSRLIFRSGPDWAPPSPGFYTLCFAFAGQPPHHAHQWRFEAKKNSSAARAPNGQHGQDNPGIITNVTTSSSETSSGNKDPTVVVGVVVALLLAACVVFFGFRDRSSTNDHQQASHINANPMLGADAHRQFPSQQDFEGPVVRPPGGVVHNRLFTLGLDSLAVSESRDLRHDANMTLPATSRTEDRAVLEVPDNAEPGETTCTPKVAHSYENHKLSIETSSHGARARAGCVALRGFDCTSSSTDGHSFAADTVHGNTGRSAVLELRAMALVPPPKPTATINVTAGQQQQQERDVTLLRPEAESPSGSNASIGGATKLLATPLPRCARQSAHGRGQCKRQTAAAKKYCQQHLCKGSGCSQGVSSRQEKCASCEAVVDV